MTWFQMSSHSDVYFNNIVSAFEVYDNNINLLMLTDIGADIVNLVDIANIDGRY